MKRLLALLLLLQPLAAHSQSIESSTRNFCSAIASINRQGVSARPGTPAALLIGRRAGQSNSTYQVVWEIAKNSRSPYCNSIW